LIAMDSQNEEISSILDRFRRSLMNNEIESLLNEFRSYRENWSMNKFRMFLTNVLIVMRSWTTQVAHLNNSTDEENWDVDDESTQRSTIDERMENSAFHLFVAMIDYLRWSKETNSMSVEVEFDMWKRIVTHRWTINEKFYIYLSENRINLPMRLTQTLHNEMFDFYVSVARWSSATKIRLIDLGFTFLLIHDNVFLGCNHILSAHDLFTRDDYLALTQHFQTNSTRNCQTKLITSMNSPEKLKIFLDFYPNVDLGQLTPGDSELYQQRTPLTIFDRLLKMETFFYETHEHLVLDEHFDFESDRPNVRSANLLFLFENLVEKGAKISINLDSAFYQNHRIPFFVTTLGFYLLSILRYRDSVIIPCFDMTDDSENDILSNSTITAKNVSPFYLDALNTNYFHYLIKRSSTFTTQFRTFFFQHLICSSPILHTEEFLDYVRTRKNVRLRNLYDQLLEQKCSLTLKQRCRLKIKQNIRHYPNDIRILNDLPPTLQSYLSFDLFHPNFVSMTLQKLTEAQAKIKPLLFDELQFHEHGLEDVNGHYDWEDQIPDDEVDQGEEIDEENDFDDEEAELFDEEQNYSDIEDDNDDEW